ncbi:MAG: hypothetical protein HXY48_03310 [Ignavibacteriaceae bacterium]|nr:hypothetical protein [Ignavibacteriaceae bacterium]
MIDHFDLVGQKSRLKSNSKKQESQLSSHSELIEGHPEFISGFEFVSESTEEVTF